jgi:starvation-inducible DNA-binding protein
MFEEQYTELFAAVDEIAERIRILGHLAPGSFADFAKLASIPEAKSGVDGSGMVADLLASHQTVLDRVHACAHIADEQDDEGTEDLMTQRIEAHQKAVWMLSATLGGSLPALQKAASAQGAETKKSKNNKPSAKVEKPATKSDKKKAPKALG